MAAPVAIVGMAAVFPGASSLDEYWDNLVAGVDATGPVPADRLDPVYFDPAAAGVDRFYCRRGGFVDAQAVVDPVALGIAPSAVDGAEPDQLLSLALAARALADAGGEALLTHRETTGVIVGRGGYLTPGLARLDQRVRTAEQLVTALHTLMPHLEPDALAQVKETFVARLGPDSPGTAIDLVPNLAASRVANRLDLGGPAYTVDAACASALVAVDLAVGELASGRCDAVLAGGVHLCQDVTMWSVFTQLGALSRSGSIRPFDRRADGLLIGEGGAMVVLRRLEDARRDGQRIYAVIRGTGVASDGRGASLMRPLASGQVLAVTRAWQAAGLDPDRLGLVEAHGTGTAAGDRTEIETLRRAFGDGPGVGPVWLGSVKSMIGHAMPAAGAASLVKAALAVHHGVAPPTLHCEEPHPDLQGSRLVPVTRATEWATGSAPAVAGVNAFGFGGINAHVVLEAEPSPRRRRGSRRAGRDARGPALLVSGGSVAEVLESLRHAAGHDGAPGVVTAPSSEGPVRLALFGPTPERLDLAGRVVERGLPWRGRSDLWFTPAGLATAGGRVAAVFPGVEPTFAPRVEDVAAHFTLEAPPAVDADAAAHDLEGLGRALVAVSRLLDTAVKAVGIRPHLVAGQSIGEWSGMIATGMIPPAAVDEFIRSIRPGSLEVPGVEFAALGCGVEQAQELMGVDGELAVSHDNCPHQTIVCGPTARVDDLVARARQAKVLSQVLPFRSGFHTPMFQPFLEPFRRALARLPLQEPEVPLWSATTCAPYPASPEEVRELALSHLVHRVRFRELAGALFDQGARIFLQVGVGSLPGLIEDTLAGRDILAMSVNVPKQEGMDQLRRAVAACWVEGVAGLDLAGLGLVGPGAGGTRVVGALERPLPLATPLVRLSPVAGLVGGAPAPGIPDELRDTPVGRELHALLQEAAATGSAVAAALHGHGAPAVQGGDQPGAVRQVTVSVDAEPAYLDHCFYRQPPGWPVVEDRFPVVPMTAMVAMMVEAASAAAPGLVAIGLDDVRALRWLAAAPPVDVAIRVTAAAPSGQERRLRVSIEGYARATVIMAARYPAPPAPAAQPLGDTWPPPVTAERMYADRWMFHGPAYQGVVTLGPMGDGGIDGILRVGPAPGMVLDNAGQLMGFWVMLRHERDRLALPTAIDRIRFFGPPPAEGRRLTARVRMGEVQPASVRASMELLDGPDVWARVDGWEDRRFDSDQVVWPLLLWPEHHGLSEPRPGGWVLAQERWRSSASRELMMRRYLGAAEREAYAGRNPRAQRLFLLGRVAAKDAVRRWLWEHGAGPLWPVQVEVGNRASGQPVVRVPGGEDLRVSIAHTPWCGVAMVAPGREVGIDVEQVEPRSDRFVEAAFGPAELRWLLPSSAGGGPAGADDDPDRHEWLARGWAAKEAVAKAAGTGLGGRPRDFAVTGRQGSILEVAGRPVATARHGDVVVAWTVEEDG